MKIRLFNSYETKTRKIEFDYKNIIKDFENYPEFKKEKSNLSLIFVDEENIHAINKEYRNRDYPTDVISFENKPDEFDELDETESGNLGDIFLCIDKVYEQAKSYGHSNEREFAFLLCHGILHLHGYDHLDDEEELIMFNKQDEILNNLGYIRK